MKYLFSDDMYLTSEYPVPFLDIIDEENYQKFKYCKEKLNCITGFIYMTYHEAISCDNYLEYDYIPISDEDAEILTKNISNRNGMFDPMIGEMNFLYEYNCIKKDFDKMSLEDFKKEIGDYVQKYGKTWPIEEFEL